MNVRIVLISAVAGAALVAGCHDNGANRASRNSGTTTSESRQNVAGHETPASPAVAPPVDSGAGTDAEGGAQRYTVDRIDKSSQRVFLRERDDNGTTEKQAGRELVFTFEEFRTLAPGAQGNLDLDKVVKEGQTVSVVRDRNGKVSRLIVEEPIRR